jgi:dihydroorotate dehydrogenase (NAD+) catalytic subunit
MSTTRPDLGVNIAGIRMKNPVMTASGTFGYGPEYADLVDLNKLGALVVKGICLHPTYGNNTPRTFETASGLINAIGLPGPGVEGFIKKYVPYLRNYDLPVIVNIWGKTIEEYAEVAARFDAVDEVAGLEVNLSCPNVKEGSALFGTDLDMFRRCLDAVRPKTKKPLIPKLAPNVSDIKVFAKAAEDCGANAISLINSMPAMAVDIETRKPRIANITGGLTGPAIKPIAVRLVWQAAQAVKIPVIGMGGIYSAADAMEFFLVGASAIAIGTANFTNPDTIVNVIAGIEDYLVRHQAKCIGDVVGKFGK